MRLREFVGIYVGTKVDFDGHYGAQCVDLFRQYCKDVLQIPRTEPVEGAKDIINKYYDMPITKCYLTKVWSPKTGDIVVFGATQKNPYGHVAICLAKDGDDLLLFEQDGFKQDGAKYAWRSMQGLLGTLRKRI